MSVAIPSGVMAAASVVQHETSSCEGWGAMPVTGRWSHTVTSHCETCKSKIFSRDEIFRLEDCVADPEQVQASTCVFCILHAVLGRKQTKGCAEATLASILYHIKFQKLKNERPNMLT